MENVITDKLIQELIPRLSHSEKMDMRSYYYIFDKYEEELAKRGAEDLKNHPVFGKLMASIPPEVAEARRKFSQELQRDAIMFDKWEPYINYNLEQGVVYAKMGLTFKTWYEAISLGRKYMVPYLEREYQDKIEFRNSLNGMNILIDVGMNIIGEAYMRERNEIITAEEQKIKQLNDELEQKVIERTAQLEIVNKELEAFSYSVSHDLRAPLRAINGYAEILNEDYGKKLDENGIRIIGNITHYSTKMGTLIDEMLTLSRLGKKELEYIPINMNDLTEGVLISLEKTMTHKAEIKIKELPVVKADYSLIYQVMFNLIANAVKYSSGKKKPCVEVSSKEEKDGYVFMVKDNGAGFDMRYSDKLFGVFQRLHSDEEFEGSGVGLAIVKRLVLRHYGRVWAEGKVNKGALFYFSLPK